MLAKSCQGICADNYYFFGQSMAGRSWIVLASWKACQWYQTNEENFGIWGKKKYFKRGTVSQVNQHFWKYQRDQLLFKVDGRTAGGVPDGETVRKAF